MIGPIAAPRRSDGFTLLEVIVAVIIAALCLSALAEVFAGGVRAAGATSEYTRATALAQSLLAGVGVEKTASDGVESGLTPDGQLNWMLSITPEPVDEADGGLVRPPLELKRVVARVVAVDAGAPQNGTGRSRAVELSTLVAVPRQTP
ncbi:MAG: type II secretion system protein [Burkholderiales bacterium]|nr:type II secretion system protein [Burkholderiales bacterium]